MYKDAEWTSIIGDAEKNISISQISHSPSLVDGSPASIAQYIDHTQLKLDATEAQIDELCKEAQQYGFAAVCVRLINVPRAISLLRNTGIKVACVIGFHEGTHSTEAKISEARVALQAGATELDVVLNRELLQSGAYGKVYDELKALRCLAPPDTATLKLIFETSQLSRQEIVTASVLAEYAGFDFIKTSTGFCGRGASLEDVQLMSSSAKYLGQKNVSGLGRMMKVKASGGVRGLEDAIKMIETGASRIGTSSGVKIIQEAQARSVGRRTNDDEARHSDKDQGGIY